MCLERDTFRTHSSCLGKMELSECELGYSSVAYSPDRSKSLQEQLNSPIATCVFLLLMRKTRFKSWSRVFRLPVIARFWPHFLDRKAGKLNEHWPIVWEKKKNLIVK